MLCRTRRHRHNVQVGHTASPAMVAPSPIPTDPNPNPNLNHLRFSHPTPPHPPLTCTHTCAHAHGVGYCTIEGMSYRSTTFKSDSRRGGSCFLELGSDSSALSTSTMPSRYHEHRLHYPYPRPLSPVLSYFLSSSLSVIRSRADPTQQPHPPMPPVDRRRLQFVIMG